MFIVIYIILGICIILLTWLALHYKKQRDECKKEVGEIGKIVITGPVINAPGLSSERALAAAPVPTAGEIRPRNGLGAQVDWFVVFKLPDKAKNCSNGVQTCAEICDCSTCTAPPTSSCDFWKDSRITGGCYFYADSNKPTLTYYKDLGYDCLYGARNPLSQTMTQLQAGKWALWNDQGINSQCSAPHAHSKGAISYNELGGFILNSSTPHWPNADLQTVGCQKTSNVDYAQHIFCFSASEGDVNRWLDAANAASLCITESSFLPSKPLAGGTTPNAPLVIPTLLGGTPITVIIKGSEDSYAPWSVVAQTIGQDIQVASWTSDSTGTTSGWGNDPYYKDASEHMNQITDASTPHGCFKTLYSYSHSKWAVSKAGNWVIFGSMNMQHSQAGRGGDFYAFQNADLWSSLSAFIARAEPR